MSASLTTKKMLQGFDGLRNRSLSFSLAVGLGVAALSIWCCPALAQDTLNQVGTPTFATSLPVEQGSLDVSNGNLTQAIPLGSFPQRGRRTFTAALVYDSRIWQVVGASWQPTNVSNSQGGWRLLTSGSAGSFLGYSSLYNKCTYLSDNGKTWSYYYYYSYYNYRWMAPDGSVKTFPISTSNDTRGYCGGVQSSGDARANDSSGFHMYITNFSTALVRAPDGTEIFPNYEDTNGNYFSTDANGNIIDTLGRTPVTVTTNCNSNASQTCYDVLNSSGGRSRYIVTTESISVSTAFGQSGVTEYSGSITVIQSIQLPDLTTYQFGYDSGTSAGHYGLLTGITFPTGGQISYGYVTFQDSFGNRNRWVSSRDSGGGTWIYSPSVITTCSSGSVGCQQKVTVTKPSGDNTVYTFTLNNGAWANQIQYYTGGISPADLIATLTRTWNFSNSCSPSPCTGNTNIQKMTETLTLAVPSGSVSKNTTYTYDSIWDMNVTAAKESKYNSTSQTPDRETDIAYVYQSNYNYGSANILTALASVTVKDGGGNIVAQTIYNYDQTTPVAAPTGTPQLASVSGPRANLTSSQRCTNSSSCSSSYVQTTMTYDTAGQVQTVVDPNGNQTSFGYTDKFYDDNGSNPPGAHTALSYPTDAYVTSVALPLSGTLSYGYYFNTGKQAMATDQNGADNYVHFIDSLDRLTHSYGPPVPVPNNNSARPWTLNVYASTETQVDTFLGIQDAAASASCSVCRHDKAALDNLGRVITQELVSDPEGYTYVATNYDATGRVLNTSHPYRSLTDPTYGLETPTYDGLNRVIKITHPDGTYSQALYGAAVGGAGLNARTTQYCSSTTYGLGYPTLSIDEAGNKREIWVDGFGRTIEGDEPDSSGNLSSGAAVCYLYDALGNATQVVAPVGTGTQTRTYVYYALSRVKSVSIPEASSSSGQCPVTYTYDNDGNVTSRSAPAPNQTSCSTTVTTNYSYDTLNRLTKISYSDGTTPTVQYGYDGVAPSSCATTPPGLTDPNPKGRRTSMCDGSGAASWSHDAAGRITAESRTILGITQTTGASYAYNLDSSIYSVTYPSGKAVTYTVSNAQRLTAAKDATSNIQFATAASYAPPGGLSGMITGQISGGFAGISESHKYNNSLEYTSTKATSTAGTALDLTLNYNTSGSDNGSVISITNNVDSGRTETLAYDPLNRILSATSSATSGTDCWGQVFGPNGSAADDALGNLTNINSGTQTQPPCQFGMLNVTVDANNHINSSSSFAYDATGNMTQDGSGYTYTFDAENRLTLASGMSGGPYCYIYDGNGLRVAKKSSAASDCTGGTVVKLYWRSLAGDALAESDGTGSTTNAAYNEYVFFAGRRIVQRNGSGSIFYYFADQVGSTRTVTTGSGPGQTPGQLCYDADFTPYGQEISYTGRLQTTACPPSYKFTGYERDSETGLDYAFARYYSARLGRFLSTDPLGGSVGSLQSHNAYTYSLNNPANLNDPSGMGPCPRGDLQCWLWYVGHRHQQPNLPCGYIVCTDAPTGLDCILDGVETPCGTVFQIVQMGNPLIGGSTNGTFQVYTPGGCVGFDDYQGSGQFPCEAGYLSTITISGGGGGAGFSGPSWLPFNRFKQFNTKGPSGPYPPNSGPQEPNGPINPTEPAPNPWPIWLRFKKWMFNADTEEPPTPDFLLPMFLGPCPTNIFNPGACG